MTFKQTGNRVVVYWCQGTDDVHSSIVAVPRTREPWERVSCPLHKVWMYQNEPVYDQAWRDGSAQPPLKPRP